MMCTKAINCITNYSQNVAADCSDCVSYSDSRTEASCCENGKRYSLVCVDRQWTVTKFRIDGGIVKENEGISSKKCDYMLIVIRNNACIAFLVELKGTDIYHALEQIGETIRLMNNHLRRFNNVNARIVCKRGIPRINATPQYTRLSRELARRGGRVIIEEKTFRETI